MAKVIIDIPNKTIEAVKAVMLAQCETEDQGSRSYRRAAIC